MFGKVLLLVQEEMQTPLLLRALQSSDVISSGTPLGDSEGGENFCFVGIVPFIPYACHSLAPRFFTLESFQDL